ncbi:hypothetical protein KI387_019900, partial [Taxus chinensis]
MALSRLSHPLLKDHSPAFSYKWAEPTRRINNFGRGVSSKTDKKLGGIYCLRKAGSKEEDLLDQDQEAVTVQVPFSFKQSVKSYGVVGQPSISSFFRLPSFGAADQAFILLSFIACTTTVAFVSLIVTAIP